MARKQRPYMVATTQQGVDLTDAAGDVALNMCVPGDGATLIDWSATIKTAGTGTQNHVLTLEAGEAGAGAAIAEDTTLLADGAVGLTATAVGLGVALTRGVMLQIKNVEGGAISDGAIINVVCLWQL